MKKEEFEKFCPDCNSAELEFYAGGHLGWQMKCKKCSWIGLPFERKVEKEKRQVKNKETLRKKIKKAKK